MYFLIWGANCPFKYANRDLNYNECNSRVTFSLPSDALRRVASAPQDVLGGGGRLLHGGFDRHLHVPVQKCVWAVQTDHGHVRGRVSFCVSAHIDSFFRLLKSLCAKMNCV